MFQSGSESVFLLYLLLSSSFWCTHTTYIYTLCLWYKLQFDVLPFTEPCIMNISLCKSTLLKAIIY